MSRRRNEIRLRFWHSQSRSLVKLDLRGGCSLIARPWIQAVRSYLSFRAGILSLCLSGQEIAPLGMIHQDG